MPRVINIGGRDFNVRPFNIKGLRLVVPKLDSLASISASGLINEQQLSDLVDIVMMALRGNEGLTRDWVEENLEVTQINDVFDAVLHASGFKRSAPGEAEGPQTH